MGPATSGLSGLALLACWHAAPPRTVDATSRLLTSDLAVMTIREPDDAVRSQVGDFKTCRLDKLRAGHAYRKRVPAALHPFSPQPRGRGVDVCDAVHWR